MLSHCSNTPSLSRPSQLHLTPTDSVPGSKYIETGQGSDTVSQQRTMSACQNLWSDICYIWCFMCTETGGGLAAYVLNEQATNDGRNKTGTGWHCCWSGECCLQRQTSDHLFPVSETECEHLHCACFCTEFCIWQGLPSGSHVCRHMEGALPVIAGTLAVVLYWGWLLSAVNYGGQWDVATPFWSYRKTSTHAIETHCFISAGTHRHPLVKWYSLCYLTAMDPCPWTSNNMT